MATQFWFKGFTEVTPPGNITSDLDSALVTTRASTDLAIRNCTQTSVTGPTSGIQALGSGGTAISWWYQVAAITISGAITKNIWGQESSMSANAGLQTIIDRCGNTGAFISTVENSEFGTELGLSTSANNWSTGTVTSTSFSNGDYIKVRIMFNDAGGTMASGFNLFASVGGGSGGAGTQGDSWVQFTETILPYDPNARVPRNPGIDSDMGVLCKAHKAIRRWRHGASGILIPEVSFVH